MKQGLYANIHAKRERIAEGSGEKMRRVGSKVAYDTDARREETMREKADRPNQLKKFIKLSLGAHRKSNVPKKSGGAVKKSNSCW